RTRPSPSPRTLIPAHTPNRRLFLRRSVGPFAGEDCGDGSMISTVHKRCVLCTVIRTRSKGCSAIAMSALGQKQTLGQCPCDVRSSPNIRHLSDLSEGLAVTRVFAIRTCYRNRGRCDEGGNQMPTKVSLELILVWACVGFFTGAGWAAATWLVGRILSVI